MPLTDHQIKSLKPTEKRYSKSDGNGLSIDIMPTGKKSWTLEITQNGKRTRKKLGDYPTITLKEARELAIQHKRRAILGVGDMPLADVIAEWLTLNSPHWTSDKYRQTVIYRLDLIAKSIAHLPISQISRNDVTTATLDILPHGHETAHRALRLLKAVFDFAVIKQYTDNNPCLLVDKLIPKTKTTNMPCLDFDEMGAFWQAVFATPADRKITISLMLYCYLAVRPSELANAKWDEFDLKKGVWIIPPHRIKTRTEHSVPLAPQPLALLQELHATAKGEYLFPSRTRPYAPMPIETPLALIKRAGYGGKMTTHGFRSLFSTYANESQLWQFDVIERCLAHAPQGAVRHAYNRAEYWEHRVKLMTWWADIVQQWLV